MDPSFSQWWELNFGWPQPFDVTLSVGGLVVSGTPISSSEFYE